VCQINEVPDPINTISSLDPIGLGTPIIMSHSNIIEENYLNFLEEDSGKGQTLIAK
jgi:hypothetical protein